MKIEVTDVAKNAIVWSGPLAEFVEANEIDRDEAATLEGDLRRDGATSFGGGAAPLFLLRCAARLTTYRWRTDAASGEVHASDADAGLAALVAQGEWAPLDSERERRDVADAAWLTIRDADGIEVLQRGRMP